MRHAEHLRNIADLILQDRLVLFVGAGLSHQATAKDGSGRRLPLWNELAEIIIRRFHVSEEDYKSNPLDLFDSISHARGRDVLEEEVSKALDSAPFEPSGAHRALAKIPWSTVYTTNYDDLLSRALGCRDPIDHDHEYERLKSKESGQPALIHLHGTNRHYRTLTGEDFANWPTKNEIAYTYLKQFALSKTFLFVGYSFSDPHLARGLIPWLHAIRDDRKVRNYAWMWRVSEEQTRLLDRRDRIEAVSIEEDQDWERTFEDLAEAIHATGKSPRKGQRAAPGRSMEEPVRINSYKLFFYRTKARVDLARLAAKAGVNAKELKAIERAPARREGTLPLFPEVSRSTLVALERALDCVGKLESGQEDDLLAVYVLAYKANRGAVGSRSTQETIRFTRDHKRTKAVVFDFGGTLTEATGQTSTWERIWTSVGYSINDAGLLHADYVSGRINHQHWCDETVKRLREKGFTRDHLKAVAEPIRLVHGTLETLTELNARGTPIYITSGSLREIIVDKLSDALPYIHEIKANEMTFDGDGLISGIWGTSFDFEGKRRFIERVALERRCDPDEILFVGNNLNDHWASKSGARTLCVNPGQTDFTNTLIWTHSIREMTNLSEILEYV